LQETFKPKEPEPKVSVPAPLWESFASYQRKYDSYMPQNSISVVNETLPLDEELVNDEPSRSEINLPRAS
jgi:hypothetical protein